MAQQLLKMIT